MMEGSLLQIKAPHFTAGLVLHDRHVSEAAPIVKYMVGWSYDRLLNYLFHKGWLFTQVYVFDVGENLP